MNGITINIDPVLLEIGGFQLRWYSVAVIAAVIVAIIIAIGEAKRRKFSLDTIYNLTPWVLIGGIIGARLFHVIDQWAYYARFPLQIIAIQQGGLAIWGAIVGGLIAAIIFTRIKRVSLLLVADILVPALLVAQIIGRAGCIANGDAWGAPTSVPWAFIYVYPTALIPAQLSGVPTHPYPVYDMLWNAFSLGMLFILRRGFRKDGLLFFSYLAFYSVGRFSLGFFRMENIWFWGLQEAQVISIIIFVIAVGAIIYLLARRRPTVESIEEAAAQPEGSGTTGQSSEETPKLDS